MSFKIFFDESFNIFFDEEFKNYLSFQVSNEGKKHTAKVISLYSERNGVIPFTEVAPAPLFFFEYTNYMNIYIDDIFYLSKDYMINSDGLFTGSLTKKYPVTKKKCYKIEFHQSNPIKISKQFNENGLLVNKINHSKKIAKTFDENGNLIKKEIYRKNLRSNQIWFSNGQPKYLYYKSSTLYIYKIWNEEGRLERYDYSHFELFKHYFYNTKFRLVKQLHITKEIQNAFVKFEIHKNRKLKINLISNNRINFTLPYLKSTWRIIPKILIK
jgi:hypothetical protein